MQLWFLTNKYATLSLSAFHLLYSFWHIFPTHLANDFLLVFFQLPTTWKLLSSTLSSSQILPTFWFFIDESGEQEYGCLIACVEEQRSTARHIISPILSLFFLSNHPANDVTYFRRRLTSCHFYFTFVLFPARVAMAVVRVQIQVQSGPGYLSCFWSCVSRANYLCLLLPEISLTEFLYLSWKIDVQCLRFRFRFSFDILRLPPLTN